MIANQLNAQWQPVATDMVGCHQVVKMMVVPLGSEPADVMLTTAASPMVHLQAAMHQMSTELDCRFVTSAEALKVAVYVF